MVNTVNATRLAMALLLGLSLSSVCSAQFSSSRSAINTIGQSRQTVRNQILNRNTVSPYLRLLQGGSGVNSGFGNVAAIYQTQVRPAVQREQDTVMQRQQIQQMQSQLNQVRNQYRQANSGYMATGHPTRYMSYSHYYPGLGR